MNILWIFVIVAATYLLFYFVYGKSIEKNIVKADNNRPTPAHSMQDGIDYVPTNKFVLFGHHFASIAGAAPIIGPIIALIWGWVPALLWVLFGNIFIGVIHDYLSLAASIRHQGKSIQWIARKLIRERTGSVFSWFILFVLILVVASFSAVIGNTFVSSPQVALASILFIVLALIMGLLMYRLKLNFILATLIGLVLMIGAILLSTMEFKADKNSYIISINSPNKPHQMEYKQVLGLYFVTDLQLNEPFAENIPLKFQPGEILFKLTNGQPVFFDSPVELVVRDEILYVLDSKLLTKKLSVWNTLKVKPGQYVRAGESLGFRFGISLSYNWWMVILLIYIIVAASLPVTVLLQPRDYLNSWILYIGLLIGGLSIIILHRVISIPGFTNFVVPAIENKPTPFWPVIPLIIACGSLSGFHSLVASGTTAKQLDKEKDALFIGFGGMLTEGILSTIVILLVGTFFFAIGKNSELLNNIQTYVQGYNKAVKLGGGPIGIFAKSYGLAVNKAIGISIEVVATLAALWVSAFALTTLDTTNRLARYIVSELAEPLEEKHSQIARLFSNPWVAAFIPAFIGILLAATGTWQALWPAFGGANQMLASIALITVSVWVMRQERSRGMIALIPALFLWITVTAAFVWYLATISAPQILTAFKELNVGVEGAVSKLISSTVVGIIVVVMLILNFILIIDFTGSMKENRYSKE